MPTLVGSTLLRGLPAPTVIQTILLCPDMARLPASGTKRRSPVHSHGPVGTSMGAIVRVDKRCFMTPVAMVR